MMRGATILWAVLAAVAGTGLFMLKYEVQAQEQRLISLRKDIADTEESIHVLKAEWSYLNDPSRLREQAERHLALHPLKPSQIGNIASLPMADPQAPVSAPAAGEPEAAQPAPVAVTPPPPAESRKAPPSAGKAAPAPLYQPPKAPHGVTTAKAAPASARPAGTHAAPAKLAAKPAAKAAVKMASARPATVALAKPLPAPRPALVSTPAAATTSTTGNVMVIKSPALAESDLTGARP